MTSGTSISGTHQHQDERATPLLDRIQSPADVKRLTVAELEKLAAEVRDSGVHGGQRSLAHGAADHRVAGAGDEERGRVDGGSCPGGK